MGDGQYIVALIEGGPAFDEILVFDAPRELGGDNPARSTAR